MVNRAWLWAHGKTESHYWGTLCEKQGKWPTPCPGVGLELSRLGRLINWAEYHLIFSYFLPKSFHFPFWVIVQHHYINRFICLRTNRIIFYICNVIILAMQMYEVNMSFNVDFNFITLYFKNNFWIICKIIIKFFLFSGGGGCMFNWHFYSFEATNVSKNGRCLIQAEVEGPSHE